MLRSCKSRICEDMFAYAILAFVMSGSHFQRGLGTCSFTFAKNLSLLRAEGGRICDVYVAIVTLNMGKAASQMRSLACICDEEVLRKCVGSVTFATSVALRH